MIILDENVVDDQRQLLLRRRIHVRQIGFEIGRKGLSDRDILPLLQKLRRPTLFTSDLGLFDRRFSHAKYCVAVLNVREQEFAEYLVSVLRHAELATQRKRMGKLILATASKIRIWDCKVRREYQIDW